MDSLTHGSFIWLEAVCAERNVARRYTVALSRDLFGASIVEFAWGRIGTKGQGRAVSFASEDEASRFARQLLRRRASAPKRIGVPYREVSLAVGGLRRLWRHFGASAWSPGRKHGQIGLLERRSGL
jgi:predicted DNA-binding WGR domain protein